MLQDVDVARFPSFGREYLYRHVWYGNRFDPLDSKPVFCGVPSLVALVLRRLSLANYCGGDGAGPMAEAATYNLYPLKIPMLLAKYGREVHKGVDDPFIRRTLNMGTQLMYSVMGTRPYWNTYNFEYSLYRLYEMSFPAGSSAGLREGRSSEVKFEGENVSLKANGSKLLQAPYAFNAVHLYIKRFLLGCPDKGPPERYCKIAFKYEVTDMMFKFGLEKLAAQLKCREFFIPHFTDFILNQLVFGFRNLVERGNTIKVGFKWWYGGAHVYATELGYPRKDIKYDTGDVKGQDYTTQQAALRMFAVTALLYINPGAPDYALYLYLLETQMDYLIAKLVNMFGNMWRWVVGTMPSGHFCTSHGNSWILAMYFWSYLCSVHLRNPLAKLLVRKNGQFVVGEYFIRFPVYGDNHTLGACVKARKYISYDGFIDYVGSFGLVIHDIQRDVPLISVPSADGGVKVTGIVFLKRHLIEVKIGTRVQVLPYKTYYSTAVKIVFGNTIRVNDYDHMIALAGLAYDTMGTNLYVYKILVQLFSALHLKVVKEGGDSYASYMSALPQATGNVVKIMKKAQIEYSQLTAFPTIKTLVSMHVFDQGKSNFRVVPSRKGMVWEELEHMGKLSN